MLFRECQASRTFRDTNMASFLWPCLLIRCQTYFSTPGGSIHLSSQIPRISVSVWIKARSIIREAPAAQVSSEYFIKTWTGLQQRSRILMIISLSKILVLLITFGCKRKCKSALDFRECAVLGSRSECTCESYYTTLNTMSDHVW